jgi:hypothetical protein
MSVIAIIICGLFLAAVWRVQVPDDLGQLADHDQRMLSAASASWSWLQRRGRSSSSR